MIWSPVKSITVRTVLLTGHAAAVFTAVKSGVPVDKYPVQSLNCSASSGISNQQPTTFRPIRPRLFQSGPPADRKQSGATQLYIQVKKWMISVSDGRYAQKPALSCI